MNITILDVPISNIPYISKVTSTSTIADQFPVDTDRYIYMVSIDNEDSLLGSYAVKLLRKNKNELDRPLRLSTWTGEIHLQYLPLGYTVTSWAKAAPS